MKMRFECTECGLCCRWGGTVKLFPNDMRSLSSFLELSPGAFLEKFCSIIDEDHIFTDREIEYSILGLKMPNESCIFLDGKVCTVHPAKPLICTLAPFSYSHWSTPKKRSKYLSESPGFSSGKKISEVEIKKSMKRETDEWGKYFSDLHRVSPKWWELYDLPTKPNLPIIKIRKNHGCTYAFEG